MHKKNNHENHRNDKVEKHGSTRNEDSKCPHLLCLVARQSQLTCATESPTSISLAYVRIMMVIVMELSGCCVLWLGSI